LTLRQAFGSSHRIRPALTRNNAHLLDISGHSATINTTVENIHIWSNISHIL
jgi:hypothetical protein